MNRVLDNVPISNLSRKQWQLIINSLLYYIRHQSEDLVAHNAGEREWTELHEYENTLTDIRFYVLPPLNTSEDA